MSEELKNIVAEHIADTQTRELRDFCPRELNVTALNEVVSIVVGVRRCGKSTLMESIMNTLIRSGVPRENIVWINFSDERFLELHQGGWDSIHTAYYSTYPQKRHSEKVYFFFDEIQLYPNWELFVERLRREENCSIYITGSSAKMLSKEIGTSLRGRTLSWELFPFSFREFAFRCGVSNRTKGSSRRLQLQHAWERYKAEGGFPAVFGLDAPLRRQLHQEYYNALLLRDVIERYSVRYPQVMRHLANRVINSMATLFSIRKVYEEVKGLGFSVSRESITQFMQWMEDAYFIFSIPAYSASIARQAREFRKVYCIDHSMAISLSSRILQNRGQILENIVFCSLRQVTPDIFYYRTKESYEVDFLVILKNGSKVLVQVSFDLSSPETKNREVRALRSAMAETQTKEGYIVTDSYQEELAFPEGRIHILSAPIFLTDTPFE